MIPRVQLGGSAETHRPNVIFIPKRIERPGEAGVSVQLDHEVADGLFNFLVITFAVMLKSDISVRINQIYGRPITVGKGVPCFIFVVEDDGR